MSRDDVGVRVELVRLAADGRLEVAFWGLLIWALVAIFRPGGGRSQGSQRDAEQILAERFATGEIDEIEYQTRLDILRSSSGRGGRR